jgi:hypothetical protein
MQTFLPYPDFTKSVVILDQRRLGKQRIENYQMLKALVTKVGGLHGGWARHPSSRMWKGYELALLAYQEATIHEWVTVRGYKDTCWEKSLAVFSPEQLAAYKAGDYEMPDWFGDLPLHRTHQASLVFKDPQLYQPLFPNVHGVIDYIWPGPTLEEAVAIQEAELLELQRLAPAPSV